MGTRLTRVAARTAEEVCRAFDLEPPSRALLAPGMTPGEFLDVLVAHGQYPDAVRLLAHALGRREAVWWACVCVRSILAADTPPAAVEALRIAEAWAYQPTEQSRWAAETAANATKFDHPAGWAAMGAFWSGNSMVRVSVPPGVAPPPPVAPGPFLTAVAVSNAVILAAITKEPEKAPDKYRRFLAQGVDVANGGGGNR